MADGGGGKGAQLRPHACGAGGGGAGGGGGSVGWAEARIKITRMTLTIKLDRNWSSFQLANSAPPLSVTGSAIAPSARMAILIQVAGMSICIWLSVCQGVCAKNSLIAPWLEGTKKMRDCRAGKGVKVD